MPTDTYIQQRNESNRKARAFLQEVLAGGRPGAVSMSNPTRVMVMRSGAYQPLPNHLSLPWRHSWGALLPRCTLVL
jgi:hypothetical protein